MLASKEMRHFLGEEATGVRQQLLKQTRTMGPILQPANISTYIPKLQNCFHADTYLMLHELADGELPRKLDSRLDTVKRLAEETRLSQERIS